MFRIKIHSFVYLIFLSILAGPAFSENRVALVIGNGAYLRVPRLPNPSHDAEDVAAALKRSGFEVILKTDLDQAGMQDAAINFTRAARAADVALFFYSGHAMQYAGVNYLAPVDAQLHDESDLRRWARVDDILDDLQKAKTLRILALDSCRNNPLAEEFKQRSIGRARGVNIGSGLAKIENVEGTIISYSTQAGRKAEDGKGRNSPYTTAFLSHIEDKEDIAVVFSRISAAVLQNTAGQQIPELSLSFFGQFYLNGPVQITVPPTATPAPANPCALAESHWRSAEAIGSVAAFEDHIAKFPNCAFATLAKAHIELLNSRVVAPSDVGTPLSEVDLRGQDYSNFGLTTTQPIQCQKACRADTRCLAWTYVKPGLQGKAARCWLKDGVPAKISDSCCISGVERTSQTADQSRSIDLTGTWSANDGGTYTIGQSGKQVRWEGVSADHGRTWSHTFKGIIQDNLIVGKFFDHPPGRIRQSGYLTIRIVTANRLEMAVSGGNFGGSVWNRVGSVQP
jgi:Caspase domain/PAN domain